MGRKHPTVKSVERRVQLTLETVSDPAVLWATPTPMLATTRSEPPPLTAPVGSVKSSRERVQKGVVKRETSKLAKQLVDVFDPHPTSVSDCT